jgi:hypothetical protein
MRISFDVNVKAVLSMVAVDVVAVGSFFAGRHYQAKHSPYDLSAGIVCNTPVNDPYAPYGGHVVDRAYQTRWRHNGGRVQDTNWEMDSKHTRTLGTCDENGRPTN